MKKINWKVRFKNPVFIVQIVVAVFAPVLSYMGLTVQDMTSWSAVVNVLVSSIQNPYVLGLMVISTFNAIQDPTTAGLSDSKQALAYTKPREKA